MAGFASERVEPVFGDQLLVVEAQFVNGTADFSVPASLATTVSYFDIFATRFASTLAAWNAWLDLARRENVHLALWGGGAKAITFLNLLDPESKRAIKQVVDINPRKAGAFIAGTGHPILRFERESRREYY